jgi:adenylate kinase
MNLILLGPPGSGKGTQAKLIEKELGLTHISTGDILRRAVAEGTPLGREARRYLDAGELVPDQVMIDLVEEKLRNGACRDGGGFLLDGFPRTVAQAEGLDAMLSRVGERVDRVVSIAVRRDELMRRLLGRSVLEGRTDDEAGVVQKRLEIYELQTRPLAGFYGRRSVLVEINGEQPVAEVFADIQERIGRGAR